jgi:hypothetical protein
MRLLFVNMIIRHQLHLQISQTRLHHLRPCLRQRPNDVPSESRKPPMRYSRPIKHLEVSAFFLPIGRVHTRFPTLFAYTIFAFLQTLTGPT